MNTVIFMFISIISVHWQILYELTTYNCTSSTRWKFDKLNTRSPNGIDVN